MLYLRNTLTEDERTVFVARFHWLYTVIALFWLAALPAAGLYLAAYQGGGQRGCMPVERGYQGRMSA